MCTVQELEADETGGTGCAHDLTYVWSSGAVTCKSGWQKWLALGVVGNSEFRNETKSKWIQDTRTAAVRCSADTVVSTPCFAFTGNAPSGRRLETAEKKLTTNGL
eukprot:COSAG05_NODE_3041_length_2393_cov_149.284912_3_plen_105_part_00